MPENRPGDGLTWTIDLLGMQLAQALAEIERLTAERDALQHLAESRLAAAEPPAEPATSQRGETCQLT